MSSVVKGVKEVVVKNRANNPEKLKSQQDYYKRLNDEGIAKKNNYNLKPVSAI